MNHPTPHPAPAILLNHVEDQPNRSVLDAQPTVRFEIEQALELSSVDPAAVTSDTTPPNTEEQPQSTYYSNDEDIIPDNAPSKWSVLKAFFGLKVQREPESSPAVSEPSDAVPTPAILLNDVEDQPNSSVLDAQPTAQVEIEQALELSAPEYSPAVTEPPDAAPTPAILLNDVEDQPNSSVLDAQPTAQFEIEQVLELSAVDPAALTSDTTPLNTEEQHSTYYSNDEDSIPDNAPSKWSVLKAFFGLKVQREPEYSPAVNEPSDAAPTPAILLNDVEDQPNSSVLDAQPTAQVEIEQALELSLLIQPQ
jgi:hypothetical protein